ncbi:hypothetical protein BGX27_000315, partial [Mortierella sp. AM989]
SGKIVGKVAIAMPSPPSSLTSTIEPNSRIKIQLLDITSSPGLPVILGQQEVLINVKQTQTTNASSTAAMLSSSRSFSRTGSQAVPTTTSVRALQGPITFKLTYDPKRIQADRSYVIGAFIMSSQQRLDWITRNKPMVLTKGAPVDNITVVLERV